MHGKHLPQTVWTVFPAEAAYFHGMAVFVIFSKMIYFTIIFIFVHFMEGQKEYVQQRDHSTLLLVSIPLTSVFIMLTLLVVNDTYILSPALIAAVTLDAVFLLAINLLVFGINQYNQKKNMEFTEMQLLLQKEANRAEYYQMLFSQTENQSILIHDIKKHLQSIHLLNEKRDHDKINAYIHQLMLSSDLKEAAQLCAHEMLNSNLLDNAVEAASNIPDAFIEINASKRAKTPFTVITAINSSRKNPFENPQGRLATSKPDPQKHGFGIKSIQKTVSKYHGDIQMYYHGDTLTFHTIITLKKPAETSFTML